MRGPATEIINVMEPPDEIHGHHRALACWHRLAHLGAVVAAVTITMIAWGTGLNRGGRHPDVMLVYIGAEDCAPCRAWRNGDGAVFFASTEFARITYREVRSLHLEDVLNDENWPKDIRDYRNSIRRSDGVPLWLVIADRAIIEQQFGKTAWQEYILPTLRSYLR